MKSSTLARHYRFDYRPDWKLAPMAYWVHGVEGRDWLSLGDAEIPAAPRPRGRRGYAVLRVEFGRRALYFSSARQLAHCIAVLSRHPLPPAARLRAMRIERPRLMFCAASHWLSRFPPELKAPKARRALVARLLAVQGRIVAADGEFLDGEEGVR